MHSEKIHISYSATWQSVTLFLQDEWICSFQLTEFSWEAPPALPLQLSKEGDWKEKPSEEIFPVIMVWQVVLVALLRRSGCRTVLHLCTCSFREEAAVVICEEGILELEGCNRQIWDSFKKKVSGSSRVPTERSWRWIWLQFSSTDEIVRWRWWNDHHLVEEKTDKYTTPDIQNEILQTMAQHVLREVVTSIQSAPFLTIIVKGTGSNLLSMVW